MLKHMFFWCFHWITVFTASFRPPFRCHTFGVRPSGLKLHQFQQQFFGGFSSSVVGDLTTKPLGFTLW